MGALTLLCSTARFAALAIASHSPSGMEYNSRCVHVLFRSFGIIATPALLSCFGMAPLDQMGTWISESAGLMQREHQGRPDPRRFAVSPPIVTVCRVKVWQPLHDRPCLQEPRLRVLEGPVAAKIGNYFESAGHESVSTIEISDAYCFRYGVLGADWRSPYELEKSRGETV